MGEVSSKGYADWTPEEKESFAGASEEAVMFESEEAGLTAIAQPAEAFDGELISVELFDDDGDQFASFLADDQETAGGLIELIFKGKAAG